MEMDFSKAKSPNRDIGLGIAIEDGELIIGFFFYFFDFFIVQKSNKENEDILQFFLSNYCSFFPN